MQTESYKQGNGCTLQADVYPVESTAPVPVIVWIHGGALIGGRRTQMHPVLRRLLTESGFAQVSIDYRLAPETKLPEIIEDLRDAFRWVRREAATKYNLDSARIGVIGHFAGGYLALMSGFCHDQRPSALAAFYGYGDIIGPWYSAPDPHYCAQPPVTREEALASVGETPLANDEGTENRFRFYLYCRQNGLWPEEIAGVDPHANPDFFTPYCPIRNITADYPPTLLLHGTGDTDVPYQQSAEMAMALQDARVPHLLVTIPGGPHGFDGRVKEEQLEALEESAELRALYRTVAFFNAHV